MAYTKKQSEILEKFTSSLKNEVENYICKLFEAREAIVKLPHQNEEGESVLHRNNLSMINLAELYKRQALNLYYALSRDDQDLIDKNYPNWTKI